MNPIIQRLLDQVKRIHQGYTDWDQLQLGAEEMARVIDKHLDELIPDLPMATSPIRVTYAAGAGASGGSGSAQNCGGGSNAPVAYRKDDREIVLRGEMKRFISCAGRITKVVRITDAEGTTAVIHCGAATVEVNGAWLVYQAIVPAVGLYLIVENGEAHVAYSEPGSS